MWILLRMVKYSLGQVVCYCEYLFCGVVFDVDLEFVNIEEWYEFIFEELCLFCNQLFYYLFVEIEVIYYVVYVFEQNLLFDVFGELLEYLEVDEMFGEFEDGCYLLQFGLN